MTRLLSEKPRLFILAGNGPCTNRGCEALLVSTAGLLSERFPGSRFISSPEKQDLRLDRQEVRDSHILHRPYSFPRRWSRDAVLLKVRRKLGGYRHPFQPFLRSASAVLALGGDNFTLDYGPALLKRQLEIGRYTRAHKVPFVIWGASIGPFSADPAIERLAAESLREADLITVRETITQEYLAAIGVSENVVKVADPAFALPVVEPPGIDSIKAFLPSRPIGLNLSPLMQRYRNAGDSWFGEAVAIVKRIDALVDRPILLLPHVTWTISDDHAFLNEVLTQVSSTRNPVALVPGGLHAQELKWIIGKLGALIAARTHATIAAFSQAVPTLSIGYSQKALGINRDLFGDARWVVNVEEANADHVGARLQELLRSEHGVRQNLSAQVPGLKNAARSGAEGLSKLLRN